MFRLQAPGSIVHVMARGIEGRNIFSSDEDSKEFLTRFKKHLFDVGFKCLAWCLMDNHFHLLLRTNENALSKLMRPLNGGYARWFNRRYERKGYLFQDRYKSILCQDQEYAKQLIRYIHLNPIRVGKVKSLKALIDWPWCGHGFLVNSTRMLVNDFQDRQEALRRFGGTERVAIKNYLSFLADSINESDLETAGSLSRIESAEIAGAQKGWPAVIGDPGFAKQALTQNQENFKRKHRQADYQRTLNFLLSQTRRKFEINEKELFLRGKRERRAEAREYFCYQAHYEELLPLSAIARFLSITISPADRLARRGKEKWGSKKGKR